MKQTNEKIWTVYMHVNKINNKIYVGITSRNPKLRWGKDGHEYNKESQKAFKNALNKYPNWEDDWEHIIFAERLTEAEAKNMEKGLIALYRTNCCKYSNPSYGYNMTDGGDGCCGFKQTDEAKEKTRQARMGKIGKDANSSKQVYCIELDTFFVSAVEAEQQIGVDRKSISQCVRGCSKSTRGGNTNFRRLHWLLGDKVCKENIDTIISTPSIVRNARPVYCVELDLIFQNANEASSLGYGSATRIRTCCSQHNKTLKSKDGVKYHWMYADDIDYDEVEQIVNNIFTNNQQRLIYCVELDRYYPCIRQAERELGLGYGCINFALKHGTITQGPTQTRLHWIYAETKNKEIFNYE